MKNTILAIVLLASVATVNCSSGDRSITKKEDMKIVCLDGVKYFLFKESIGYSGFGFMSPKYSKSGRIETCN